MDKEKDYKDVVAFVRELAAAGRVSAEEIKLHCPWLVEHIPTEEEIIDILKALVEDAYCGRVSEKIPTEVEYEACIEWVEKKKTNQSDYDRGLLDGASAKVYNCWKPTKEQMRQLKVCADGCGVYDTPTIRQLYEQLKALLYETQNQTATECKG